MRTWMAMSALVLAFSVTTQAKTEMIGKACKKDLATLCPGIKPGKARLLLCLKENEDKLSAECKAQQEEIRAEMKKVHGACHEDVVKFCEGAEVGRGRMMKCMKEHEAEISQVCKDQLAKMPAAKKMK